MILEDRNNKRKKEILNLYVKILIMYSGTEHLILPLLLSWYNILWIRNIRRYLPSLGFKPGILFGWNVTYTIRSFPGLQQPVKIDVILREVREVVTATRPVLIMKIAVQTSPHFALVHPGNLSSRKVCSLELEHALFKRFCWL